MGRMTPSVDAPLIALSPACLDDAPFLLAIRNHPETRRGSFSEDAITQEEHQAWLTVALASPDRCRLFIGIERGLPIGMGRLNLDSDRGEAEISVTVHWDHQGRGVGTALIEALAREATTLGVKMLVAQIKEGNTGSRIAFARAGFAVEEWAEGVVTMLRRL